MAIIIPSKNIYGTPTNDKILNNEINGVSYTNHRYEELSYLWYNLGSMTLNTSQELSATYYSDFLYLENGAKRQRYKIECKKRTYNKEFSKNSITFPASPNLEKTYVEQKIWSSDEKTSWYARADFTDKRIFKKVPKPNEAQTTDEIIDYVNNYFVARMFVYVLVVNDTSTTYTIVNQSPSKIFVYIENYQKNGESWELISPSASIYDWWFSTKVTEVKWKQDASIITTTKSVYGNAEQIDFALEDNELMRYDFYRSDTRRRNNAEICRDIVNNYSQGKETVELTCSISNYFDENGTQLKFDDGENMAFDIYDEVVPMVYTNLGKDVPISLAEENKAKCFTVIGVEIYYDGAVMQKLTMQENGNTIEIIE